MISSVRIQNFRCLRDVTVRLSGLTVLIGKNDTGKTSFLDAILYLEELVSGGGPAVSRVLKQAVWRGADPERIQWDVEIRPTKRNGLPGRATYRVAVDPEVSPGVASIAAEEATIEGVQAQIGGAMNPPLTASEGPNRITHHAGSSMTLLSQLRSRVDFPSLRAVSWALSSSIKYRLDPDQLRRPTPLLIPGQKEQIRHLRSDGFGLPTVLELLLGTYRESFDALEEDLRQAIPQIRRIRLRTTQVGDAGGAIGKELHFELASGAEIPAAEASDGALLVLGYLTLVHAPDAPAVLLLEEPENGIHPRQLERVMGYLGRIVASDRGSRACQIVLTTHSPYLLDHVSPAEVVVFGRHPTGESVAAPLESLPGVRERIERGLTPGELWFVVGEDQLLAERIAGSSVG